MDPLKIVNDITNYLNGPLKRQLGYDEKYFGGYSQVNGTTEMFFTSDTGVSTVSAMWISPNIERDEEGNILDDQTEVTRDFEGVVLDYLTKSVPSFRKGSLRIDYEPELIQISFKTL
ncbi:MAG TPA: hypothetical protein VKR58_11195 [Aquella sp.]|nr:hypothetical protein [Aquella sp.]